MKKKLVIIGAGIAGMTAGIYALKSGFDVTIYEQHSISGGTCTSWKRKGYTFEGAVHWLTGSVKQVPLNKIWRETGALSDEVEMFKDDPYLVYEYNGKNICLYRRLDKLKKHFIETAPEDSKAIEKLCKDIKSLMAMKMPIMDEKGLKVKYKNKMKLFDLLKMVPALFTYKRLMKISMKEYVAKFKNEGIRNILTDCLVPEDFCALSGVITLATFITDGEYPNGGSLAMTKRMEDKFISLGGKIYFNSKVDKIITEKNSAKGIVLGGKEITADAVIVTQDILNASERLFDKPLKEDWIENLKVGPKSQICTFISIGIKENLSNLPHGLMFNLDKPVTIAGIKYSLMGINNYSNHPEYAPAGCTAITTNFMGDSYDWWLDKKKSGNYDNAKAEIAGTIIKILEEKFPKIKGKIEVVDVATPLTYERYTGAYKGSWMTTMYKGSKMNMKLGKSASINNLYFAGFRLVTPGGLPVALMTGRKAAQLVCKDFNYVFEGEA